MKPIIYRKNVLLQFSSYIFSHQVENLQDEVQSLVKSLEEQKHSSLFSGHKRNESFEWLKAELQEIKHSVEKEKDKMASTISVLDTVFFEMKNIFALFRGDAGSLINLVGEFNSRFLISCWEMAV